MNRVSGTIKPVSPEVTRSSKDRKRESRKDKNDLNFPNTQKRNYDYVMRIEMSVMLQWQLHCNINVNQGFPGDSAVKNLPAMQEVQELQAAQV